MSAKKIIILIAATLSLICSLVTFVIKVKESRRKNYV